MINIILGVGFIWCLYLGVQDGIRKSKQSEFFDNE